MGTSIENCNKATIKMIECTPDGDLVSRSQAKRVLARLNMFETVTLDFDGVTELEQGFADELFRVGLKDLADVTFEIINAAKDIEKMIKRVTRPETENRILFVDAV